VLAAGHKRAITLIGPRFRMRRFEGNLRKGLFGGIMSTLREPLFEERALSDREFEELLLKTWEYMCSEEDDVHVPDSATEPPSLG
jgi:hypothetical protein